MEIDEDLGVIDTTFIYILLYIFNINRKMNDGESSKSDPVYLPPRRSTSRLLSDIEF